METAMDKVYCLNYIESDYECYSETLIGVFHSKEDAESKLLEHIENMVRLCEIRQKYDSDREDAAETYLTQRFFSSKIAPNDIKAQKAKVRKKADEDAAFLAARTKLNETLARLTAEYEELTKGKREMSSNIDDYEIREFTVGVIQ